ncbi:MAG TPA: lysophospholipid acyltransferase family protein [Candidatus Cloacimonas sp.]|nr:lysophospholipid acyltransferase family protein [Candidatus Cloacimonas sp.]MDD2250466.1 lysophospholipid acyltransferase family protein [Candidatus Cloacimonadota bacterium]MDD4677277.1 lysophospholipid acyltransferase family protein [Candidatus Cloacimonadota bacterium]HNV93241.1 lysophospholipid acyltransferase family protein [Candidatus Cloacimonas sp.]HNZ32914.1 lysophospholipid acyltransferase family protein [Candidatus Cloacimonas sp.]
MPNHKLKNRIEYVSFRIALAGLKLLPPEAAKAVLKGLFWFGGWVIGIRKNVALQQLSKIFPDKNSKEKAAIIKKLYRNMALSIYECYLMDDETLYKNIRIEGREFIEEALSLKRGAIFATAHYGNWEAARILPKAGIPISGIAKPQRNVLFDKYTNTIRERCGMRIINMKRGLRDIVHEFRENRIVAILIDQNAGGSGLLMNFLGFPASHWKGVAKLSLRYRVPIVPCFARRSEDDRIVFEFFPVILHNDLDDKEENYKIVLEEVNKILEHQIREHPEQWFWVHLRWKHSYDMLA